MAGTTVGLINLDPPLEPGERVLWRRPAALCLPGSTVAGTLHLTTDGFLFMPNRLNRRRNSNPTRITAQTVLGIDVAPPTRTLNAQRNGGLRARLRISAQDGVHLFVINHPQQVAEQLQALGEPEA
ncbi:MAG TPA: hypothetical protein VME01_05800 [Solirubrobacteraceae bacterium]|nr:hypothetical protein [Solirubrobacteraceae bacterium]